MTRTAFFALLSHWRRQPLQLVTLILGLALATGLWSAVQAINGEARASYARAADQIGANSGTFLTAPDTAHIKLETYVALRRAGWLVTPVLEGRIRLNGTSVTLMGVDFLNYPVLPGAEMTETPQSDNDLSPLDVLTGEGRLFMRGGIAAEIGTDRSLPPVIETSAVPTGIVMTDIGTAERLLDQRGQISRLLVLPDQPDGLVPLASLAPHLSATVPEGANDVARLTDSFHLNLTAFGLLSFAVGLFIVHGTVGLAFQQRRAMFRTLRALGLPAARLTVLILIELLALALFAGILGLIIGYLVAAALLPDVAATLRGLYGAPVTGGLTLRPMWFASGLGMAVIGALVAGAQGVWQVSRLPILSAPGLLTWSAASRGQARRMALTGVGLMVAGLIFLWAFEGLVGGFALLAGLLLGAAMILPALLGILLDLINKRTNGPLSEWVFADLRAQLPGLSLALMALLLALATNIGVGTMVSSFRETFTGWLDQRLASELYLTAETDAQGAQISDWLLTRSEAVLPIRFGDITLFGQSARIYGIADHPTYRNNWPLIAAAPDVWDQVAANSATLINEQLARREGIWPGDQITLAPGWTLSVAGVYSDYGNPSGQAIVSLPELLEHFPSVPNRQFGIRIAPEKAAQLAAQLRDTFDLPVTAVIDQAGIKASSLGIFEKTFVVTGALNILTLGVASFAILTSLLTLWTMRLPHVAPVWALGVTRAQLSRLELGRSIVLSGLTAVLALPLGLVLAWVLLAIINVEAFGWKLPMYLFPADWLRLGILAILAGGIAAALPAGRLRKTPPSDLLRVFANER